MGGAGWCLVATVLMLAGLPTASAAAPNEAPPPPGFISFCVRHPDQCATSPGQSGLVALDNERWRTIQEVNSRTNRSIRPENDEEHYGRPEYWEIPKDGLGDCDDYALTKRKELIDAGLPEQALRIAVVRMPAGDLHAVLTVVTDKGDFVLDNLTDQIVDRSQTPYTWIERQSPDDPRQWEAMQSDVGEGVVTGAVK